MKPEGRFGIDWLEEEYEDEEKEEEGDDDGYENPIARAAAPLLLLVGVGNFSEGKEDAEAGSLK